MLERARGTATAVDGKGFPHWADPTTGKWVTTVDGDWTGGFFAGILWLGYHMTGDRELRNAAVKWGLRLRSRVHLKTAFKGSYFYGCALGSIVAQDAECENLALAAAESLREQYDPALHLIPLGTDAEEAGHASPVTSSIDSLLASPLLYWASERNSCHTLRGIADQHTKRVLRNHFRLDGGIIQSSELDPTTGEVRRHFTHKGHSDHSVWGRAQAWGMLYSSMAYVSTHEDTFLRTSMQTADWWLANIPDDGVAYWDFDDPAIPVAPRDTAATAIASAALLRLAHVCPNDFDRLKYQRAAERAVDTLVSRYLTREYDGGTGERRGMLTGGCFNNRPDARSSDRVTDAELIFGSYFLLECLSLLTGALRVDKLSPYSHA